MYPFSAKLDAIKPTIFSHMTDLANQYRAINLGQGFPDFDGPDFVKDAAIRAIKEGKNQYCASTGIPELRSAIAEKYHKIYGVRFDPQTEITVYSGATEAIFSTLFALLNPNDEIILFEPFYDAYLALCYFTGAIPKYVRIAPDFSINFEDLKAAVSPRTKCVILTNPHNPMGKIFTREELSQIQTICPHSYIIADEVYEHITYEKLYTPISAIANSREHAITISSTAKTFSLTGWKIGYTLTNADITKRLRMVHQFLTFSTSTPLQYAMVEALRAPASYYETLKQDYKAKRDLLNSILVEAGFQTYLPEGSYYIVTDISDFLIKEDVAFCEHLIKKVGVAAIPMSAFYSERDPMTNLVRFCFAKRNEILEEAGKRLSKL